MDSPTLCKHPFLLLNKPILKNVAFPEANFIIVKMKNSLKNTKGFPYREARLVDCGGDISKRWYVVFYCWDLNTSKLVRIRDYSINKKDTVTGRKSYGKALVQMYNFQLYSGYAIGLETEPEKEKQLLTVWDGIEIALKHLNATRHRRQYIPLILLPVFLNGIWMKQKPNTSILTVTRKFNLRNFYWLRKSTKT